MAGIDILVHVRNLEGESLAATVGLRLAERLKAVERSARVRRYHTEPVIHQQNVGEHTYGVMWFILLMVDNPSAALLNAALMHVTPEYAVGDVPSPTKKAPVIKQAFDQLEDEVLERLLC